MIIRLSKRVIQALFISLIAWPFVVEAQQNSPSNSVIWKGDSAWASSKLAAMNLDEKIGQLFMVAAYSNKGADHLEEISELVREEKIGGLIFMQGGPIRQAKLTNYYQQLASIPLMIAMDAEWGLAMRLDSTFKFPWPITVGATRDSALAYRYGKEIALHCKRLGVHINFAPVVDINTNPKNPIINARSFGEDPEIVTKLSEAYMLGMQDQGVMACAKHFPGHGDTDSDSHKTLPTVAHDFARLDSIELRPYRHLVKSGLGAVMAAHLNVPALDPTGKPSSLSKPIIQDFLKDSLGFGGLVFTDALNMRGVADHYGVGKVDVEAFIAGNDVLLFSQDVDEAKDEIEDALENGRITEGQIDQRVFKILMAKSWLGLQQKKHVEPTNIVTDLNPESSEILNRDIYRKAITVLKNKEQLIPIEDLQGKKIACLTAGVDPGGEFARTLKLYSDVDQFEYDPSAERQLLTELGKYDIVIAGIYTSNDNPWKSFKIKSDIRDFVRRLSLQNKIILNLFANPYSLNSFEETAFVDALMVSYQNHPDVESMAAQIIFGAEGGVGRLPVSTTELFPKGFGLKTASLNRLGYGLPGEVGLDRNNLLKIDLLVDEAIRNKATPGAQVLVARNGKVVYMKSYGHHTYEKEQEVDEFDIYDLASITKMAASVPMLMKLVEEQKIDLDKTLGTYLPKARGTNKEDLVIRDILSHQARLLPWIPFYLETVKKGVQVPGYYSALRDFNFPNQVTDKMFSSRYTRDTILKRIYESKLLSRKEYKYSDLGYYMLMDIIETMEGAPLNYLVDKYYYGPLGAYTMTFNPSERFPDKRIAPTEKDSYFRQQTVKGYVHDQGAAMMGGVAGHAGLFSNANDLAKLMQMYLQFGEYGGQRFFDSVIVKEFTRCQYCDENNRRGVGFDKPQLDGPGPTCDCVSPLSFGHSGFTGTLAWADPSEEIIYIFLSNRVYPDASNNKLLSLSTRTRIQEVIYQSIQHEEGLDKLLGNLQP